MPIAQTNSSAGAGKGGGDNTKMLLALGACVLVSVAIGLVVYFLIYKKRNAAAEGESASVVPTAALPAGYISAIPVLLTPTQTPQTPTEVPTQAAAQTVQTAATATDAGACNCKWNAAKKVFTCELCSETTATDPALAAMEVQSAPGMSPDASLLQLSRTGPKFRKKPCGDGGRTAYLITDGSNFLSDQGGLLVWSPNATCWTMEKAGCGAGYVRMRSPSGAYLRKLTGSNVLALVARLAPDTPDGCWKL